MTGANCDSAQTCLEAVLLRCCHPTLGEIAALGVTKTETRAAKKTRKACEEHANEVNSLLPIRRAGSVSYEPESVRQHACVWGSKAYYFTGCALDLSWSIPHAKGESAFYIRLSFADARRLATALLKFADACEELEAIRKNE